MTLLLTYAFIALFFSFLCSVAEAVLLTITPTYIAGLKMDGNPLGDRLEKLKLNIDRPLAAILTLNTIAHTAGAAGVGALAAREFGSQAVGWVSAILTLLILVLSEIIPKTLGALYWRQLSSAMAFFVRTLIILLYPLVRFSELVTRGLERRAGKDDVHQSFSRNEFQALVELGSREGTLKQEESRILMSLLRFREARVRDAMTPRPVIFSFPEDKTVGEVMGDHAELNFSRIPIHRRDQDHMTGFVLKTDLLSAMARGDATAQVSSLRRPLRAIPAEISLATALDLFVSQRLHMVLVVDEYGGTEGLLTLEDIFETLLGTEIVDEADGTVDMQELARNRWHQRTDLNMAPRE